jgi:glyoxylase-like metal-dependent hydrolase (beta-lactamase superfamily II)
MRIETFPIGPLETNSYLAVEGGQAVAVDVGGDPSPMLRFMKKHGVTLTHVLVTHMHFDHIYGVKALSDATGAKVLGSLTDGELLRTELGSGGFMGFPKVPSFAFDPAGEGEMELLGQPCRVLATPGHSLGSLSYHFPNAQALFSGDVLFYRSIGRTDFPGGSMEVLIASVREKIFTLPGGTVIYPGHGPETSVGDERLHNPYFSEFAKDE